MSKLLRYRLRLLLVSIIVIGYASYISWGAIDDKNKSIAFSQLEVTGAEVLPPIKELLILTQKLRGVTASYKAGNSILLKEVKKQSIVVKNKFNTLKTVLKNANLNGIDPLVLSLDSKMQNTIDNALLQTEKESFENYSTLIKDELTLIVKVGDMSNLILDPDLDTYYLMDLVINKLPLITETLAKARGIGSMVLISKYESKETQLQLAFQLGRLRDNLALAKNGLDSAYSYNNSLQPIINPVFNLLIKNVHQFEEEVRTILKGELSINPAQFFQDGTDVISDVVTLYSLSNKHLIRLLNIRIDKMKAKRDAVVIESVIFFLILIVLFYVAYDYLYKNILIRKATKKEQIILKELQRTNDSLMHSLSHDALTGIYNRSSLIKDLTELQEGATIMLIDIKAFKEINDIYGNDFGNKVLIRFTNYLDRFFSDLTQATLYRIGGDEFALLLLDTSIDQVMQIATTLEKAIRNENFDIDSIRTNLSVSIAINTTFPLLENADLALKAVKKEMNRHIIEYKEDLSVKKEWKKNIEVVNLVKSALQEDRIVPYFQGIVNLKTMKIEKYEALVRLILPSNEVLSPYAFLDIVSKTQYYYDITEVMIRKTMQVAKLHPSQRFSINVSMKDITNINITHTLFKLFDADKETAQRVDIELLETELVAIDDARIEEFITKVHDYGSKVLIDDFGTGYSNFSYLSNLDIDIIKIDASITKEITSDSRKLHILKTIHNFSSGMNMLNVAEYVETKETALLLKELGIEYAQGYLFSKPAPAPLSSSDVTL